MKVVGSLEALEARRLLAVTIEADGWTNFTRDSAARTIYVSSSAGSDKNDGLTSAHPVATIGKARSLVRDGTGDWMLLRCGDVWFENLGGWYKSGKSKDFPTLISSYGKGERPVLETGASDGFNAIDSQKPIRHVAITGILFYAHTRDPDSPSYISKAGGFGVHTLTGVDDLLIENCVFDSYVNNLSIQGTYGTVSHVGVRRNQVIDAYPDQSMSVGLYMSNTSSVLIEGNVFDHNGWNDKVAPATIYGHNVYLSESNSDVYIRSNIISNAGSHGLQARSGGTIQGNLFINNPIGLLFGNGRVGKEGGVQGDVSGNVFLGTGTINGAARGWAMEIGNTAPGGTTIIANNIFAQDQLSDNAAIIFSTGLGVKDNPDARNGIHDVTLEGNIVYRWNAGITINGDLVPGGSGKNALNGLTIRNNDFQRLYSNRIISQGQEYNAAAERFSGNRYFSSGSSATWFKKGGNVTSWDQWYAKVDKTSRRVKVKYDDPERKVETYNAMLGGKPSVGAFLTQARLLARRIWDPRYSASAVVEYMHQGFKVRKIPPKVTATNLSSKNTGPTASAIFYIFDKDVSSQLSAGDLIITNRKTRKRISSSSMKVSYDASTHTATWTFPGLKDQKLAAGDYNVKLLGAGITDVKGTALDGNYDGVGGDSFFSRLKIKASA